MKHFLLTLTLFGALLASPAQAAESAKISINGLICDYCAQALTQLFGKQAEVADVEVNLSGKYVQLSFADGQSLDDARITQLITDSGYDVVSITRDKTP